MATASYTKTGTKSSAPVKLDKNIFGLIIKDHALLKQVYIAYLDNGRTNNAVTKTRGLVSGGGRKPWKQKGTGRARFGSTRNPIWRTGGIVFGPTGEENYSKKVTKKTKNIALRQALSLASTSNKIAVIETFSNLDGKTKDFVKLLDKIEANGKVLCVVSDWDRNKEKAANNLQNVKVTAAANLNVYDTVNADKIVITTKALEVINERLKG